MRSLISSNGGLTTLGQAAVGCFQEAALLTAIASSYNLTTGTTNDLLGALAIPTEFNRIN
jgi:hypothetical protein